MSTSASLTPHLVTCPKAVMMWAAHRTAQDLLAMLCDTSATRHPVLRIASVAAWSKKHLRKKVAHLVPKTIAGVIDLDLAGVKHVDAVAVGMVFSIGLITSLTNDRLGEAAQDIENPNFEEMAPLQLKATTLDLIVGAHNLSFTTYMYALRLALDADDTSPKHSWLTDGLDCTPLLIESSHARPRYLPHNLSDLATTAELEALEEADELAYFDDDLAADWAEEFIEQYWGADLAPNDTDDANQSQAEEKKSPA